MDEHPPPQEIFLDPPMRAGGTNAFRPLYCFFCKRSTPKPLNSDQICSPKAGSFACGRCGALKTSAVCYMYNVCSYEYVVRAYTPKIQKSPKCRRFRLWGIKNIKIRSSVSLLLTLLIGLPSINIRIQL